MLQTRVKPLIPSTGYTTVDTRTYLCVLLLSVVEPLCIIKVESTAVNIVDLYKSQGKY